MSTGHVLEIVPLSMQVFERILCDPRIRERIYGGHKFDREYDLPFLAGYSEDGKTIYFDRHLPDKIKFEFDGRKFEYDPTQFVSLHEIMETACVHVYGWGYEHAHAAANAYERRGVLASGMPWKPYNDSLVSYVKHTEHEKIKRAPPDLDLTPYVSPPVNRVLLNHLQEHMGGKHEKKHSKQEVSYENEGMAGSHCGPVSSWPARGACENYEAPNGCALVRGYISPRGWCELFEKKES